MSVQNIINNRFSSIVSNLALGDDGIWSGEIPSGEQKSERELREQVASKSHDNYITDIAKHHSIPVMDYEVSRFLEAIPQDGFILDVGGCWGWHWRNIQQQRPDISVVIVDFVRSNLLHAQNILGDLIGDKIILIHADATSLAFNDELFDGFWTVQTFQHIPDFKLACSEAHRVLKQGGYFINYSLHITPMINIIYRLLGKSYHKEGKIENLFFLNKASDQQLDIIAEIFGGEVKSYYTECSFHPDLKFTITGRLGSWLGALDARFGRALFFRKFFARQRSFEAIK